LAGWRHLLRACHSDVAKSRQPLLRGCGGRTEMIIVLQGLDTANALIGCWGRPSCRGQGPRNTAGLSGYEEDLNA
jgi:hypothetical protein